MTSKESAWEKLPSEKKRTMQRQAEELVSGSIIESAATQNERGKWLDAIGEYFDGPTAEAVRAYAEDRGTKMEMGQAGQSTSPA